MADHTYKTEELLTSHSIKVTSQRVAVYDALKELGHASADQIVRKVQQTSPSVTVGTIYNVLECLAENRLVRQVFTRDNKMYFDVNTTPHYHLHDENGIRIEDYDDPQLEAIIEEYFRKKPVQGFTVSEIRLKLVGRFDH